MKIGPWHVNEAVAMGWDIRGLQETAETPLHCRVVICLRRNPQASMVEVLPATVDIQGQHLESPALLLLEQRAECLGLELYYTHVSPNDDCGSFMMQRTV